MHVGVKETIAEYLRKEYLHAVLGEPCDIDMVCPQPIDIVDRNEIHALQHEHIAMGVVEKYLRHVQ